MPINFTANYIQSVNVQKRYGDRYIPYQVSFVELDKYDKRDMKTLKDAAVNWGDDSYAYNIYDSALNTSLRNKNTKKHFFALTKQMNNYNNIKEEDIFGLAEFDEKKNSPNVLECIQVNPKYKQNKEFFHLGSSLLGAIKSLFIEKPIYVFSDEEAVGFYEKNDFVKSPYYDYDYYWNA